MSGVRPHNPINLFPNSLRILGNHLNKEDATFLPVIVSFSGITNYQAMVTSR
jgi:hypothetical protein